MSGVTYLGFGLSLLATVGILFSTCFWEWKRNSVQSSQASVRQLYISEGLWVRCSSPFVGQFQCDSYDAALIAIPAPIQGMRAMMCLSTLFEIIAAICAIMAMPCVAALRDRQKLMVSRVGGVVSFLAADLQGQRAMMVIATILAVFGFIAGTVGMDCITAMQGTKSKTWTGRSGGGMMLLAGALCLASVSWYAADIVFEFWSYPTINTTFKYEFGSALYVGWVASVGVLTVAAVSWYAAGVAAQYYNNAAQNQSQTFVYVFGSALYVGWIAGALAIISGILLACCNCAGGEDVEESYRYNYKPASKPATRAAEYV